MIDLDGWVPREMVLADRAALNVNIPAYVREPDARRRPVRGRRRRRAAPTRNASAQEQLEAIKEQFRRALAYDKVRRRGRGRKAAPPAPDPRLAALVPYAKGEKPVIFHAEHRDEILDALKIAEELKLKAIISGGAEAWKVADALKAAEGPGAHRRHAPPARPSRPTPTTRPTPTRPGCTRRASRSRSAPRAAGPTQATAGRNLPYEAATAVAFGLPEDEALKAVTLTPAQILGVADQVGSLEVGKRANLVVTAGHILQPTTEVKALFIDGKPLTPESRHTRLYAKYRRRLAEVEGRHRPAGTRPVEARRHRARASGSPPTGGADRR